MEEEAQRIAQGQVLEPVPEAVLCKDSTPSSINAIFSPPVNQFDYNNAEPQSYNPFDGETPFKMDAEDAATPASQHLQKQEEPMEGSEAPQMSARDSDSDEGIPAAGNNDQAFNPHEAPTPTAEEVDAALAELDSIPDEVCESGDVDEEDEEEEEWSYYRMDLQTQPQGEDVLVPGSSEVMDQNQDKSGAPLADISQEQPQELETGNGLAGSPQELMEESRTDNVETDYQPSLLTKSPDLFQTEDAARFNKETNLMETSISNVGEYLDNYEPSSSPHVPGSPRSVEGFVTSVDLNTPEEIGVTHPQDMNGSGVEQSSGPFSVYVSSSPEPVSLDPHVQTSGDFGSVSEMTNGQVENDIEASGDFSPVEIVHAQSTVEVVASPTPSEKKEAEMPEVPTSPIVPVNQTVDVTFIPEPAVEPTAEKPVPVFIDEGTPVSEGEPEIPSSVLADTYTSEPATADLLSKEPSNEPFIMEQTCTAESPVPEQLKALVEGTGISHDEAPTSEPMSPVFDTASPLMEETPVEAGIPPSMEPTLLSASPAPEPSPALASPVEMTPAKPLSAPMSPVLEPSPAPMSPVQESSPTPMSPVHEPSPSPMSPVQEPSPVPISPMQEPLPAPMSPVQEPSPAPMSPVQEPSPAPASPVEEPAPAPASPVQEPSPTRISPVEETILEPVPPVEEAIPASVSPLEKPALASVTPVEESAPTPISTVEEPALISTSPVAEPSQAPMPTVLDSSVPEHALEQEIPTLSPVVLETQVGSPSVASDIMETAALDTEKDEIQINEGTVVIPVVAQEDIKETKPELAKSPAKTTKTPGKTADKPGKPTPSRSTPGKATPTRTPSARTPLTKPTEKKPTPSQTQKPAARPAAEKTTAARTRVTPTSSATSKQPLTKPSTKTVPKSTTAKPLPSTTTKPTERKAAKPAAPTVPRPALSKPSTAPNKPVQPTTAGRTTTTTSKRPISAPTKRIEKTDASKLNGTATKPLPRTTTSRPATTSTVTRKPVSATPKSVPEKETKNTTNRILSTTAKSVQKASPGTARSVTSKATALTKTTGKVDGTSSPTTATSKARMAAVTKSSTTTKTTGVAAKKTLVSKTSTTKSKTAATATSSKVQKSKVISAPVTNGENKIAHEETSVEVIEKCAAEDVVQCSTTEQVISTETVEVIVNGDH